jgi:hypothetical protein
MSNRVLGFAAVFVLAVGLAGNIVQDAAALPQNFGAPEVARLLVYDFVKALKLFSLALPDDNILENWLLVCARLVGSLVAMVTVFKLIATAFTQDLAVFLVSFYAEHTVVLGYGARNAQLLVQLDTPYAGRRIVIVDNDPGKANSFGHLKRAMFLQADLNIGRALLAAKVESAGLILIGTGSDERNLALARQVVNTKRSVGPARRIILTINDAGLAERCSRDPDIARPENGDEIYIFNIAMLTARSLLGRTPLSDLALAAKQDRVHLVIAGFSEVAQEIVMQFLRISACRNLGAPRIDIVAANGVAVLDRLLERCPNLAGAIREVAAGGNRGPSDHLPLAWAAGVRIHAKDPSSLAHDETLVEAISAAHQPTAIVIATGDAAENVKIGLALKQSMRVTQRLSAPVYVRVTARSSLEGLLCRYDGSAPRPATGQLSELRGSVIASEAIEPFGALEEICNMQALTGTREVLARALHEVYATKRIASGLPRSDPSVQPWSSLQETYRQANRRSADHLPLKLLSIGAADWWDGPDSPALAEAIKDASTLEALARLEHISWRIDREVDGWRYGPKRDNQRMQHPDLVDYGDLSEESKDYDREMIKLLGEIRL